MTDKGFMTDNKDLLLEVKGLKTHFFTDEGIVKAVDGVDFEIERGKIVCVVGESGCGKSVTARSILQIVGPPSQIVDGQILFHRRNDTPGGGNTDIIDLTALHPWRSEMRNIRGKDIGMIFQEPMTSLSPVHTIGDQITESIHLHMPLSKTESLDRAVELLSRVGIPQPRERVDAYPAQLSGGMRQRAMIAMALACNPSLLIADEPTTALDVTTQAQILDLMWELREGSQMSIMLITHDLGVVAEMADEVVVMYLGNVVERGDVNSIFHDPKHPYTKALLRSIPKVGIEVGQKLQSIRGMVPDPFNRPSGCPFHNRCDQVIPGVCDQIVPSIVDLGENRQVRCLLYDDQRHIESTNIVTLDPKFAPGAMVQTKHSNSTSEQTLLEVKDLKMHFPVRRGLFRRTVGYVKAVDGVDLKIRAGETLGLVGESGCGKTTTGRCIIRDYNPTDGQILYQANGHDAVDLAPLNDQQLKSFRRDIRMVFQDPYSSLDPRMPVLEIVGESLKVHGIARGQELEDRVAQLLRLVGLRPEYMRRYPHAFSGGERQRVGIARALALNPKLVICDEAVSALDVSVRAQILNLLQDLQAEFNLTYLFVAHDLSVVEYLCSRIAVMYVGRIVELAETTELYGNPLHPYTEALLSAVPKPDPRLRDRSRRIVLEGDVPDPAHPPSGCYFHPRCAYSDGKRCVHETPALREVSPNHYAACHFAETLTLRGVVGEGVLA